MLHSWCIRHDQGMVPTKRSPFLGQVLSCWNWKCALLSASARSLVYIVAMLHTHRAHRGAVVLVEMAYVTLTAGIYAALQQRALGLRSRPLGSLIVVLGVPGLAQVLDWSVHYLTGAPAPGRATVAVCIFAAISAFFHLHVMRNGVFLSGHGHTLADDFRRIPRLVAEFVAIPFVLVSGWAARLDTALESDARF